MSSLTQANGMFSNCGPGVDNYELYYTCVGPSCSSISGFQGVTCQKFSIRSLTDNNGPGTDSFSCSNNFQCPDGISSYQSNFTFSQNAPDTLEPAPNDANTRVQQQQSVLVTACGQFSLKSNGTEGETSVSDLGTQPDCEVQAQSEASYFSGSALPATVQAITRSSFQSAPSMRSLQPTRSISNPESGISSASQSSLDKPTRSISVSATNEIASFDSSSTLGPELLTGTSTRRQPPKGSILLILCTVMLLLTAVQADGVGNSHAQRRASANLDIRTLSDRVRNFAAHFEIRLAADADAAGEDGNTFAHDLVADVITTVCGAFYRGESVEDFTPTIVGNCVRTVYGDDRLPKPGIQFLAVFGASLLCDYIVSEAFPLAKGFSKDRCSELEDLAQKIDPEDLTSLLNVPGSTISPTENLSTPTEAMESLSHSVPPFVHPTSSPMVPSFLARPPSTPHAAVSTSARSIARSKMTLSSDDTLVLPPQIPQISILEHLSSLPGPTIAVATVTGSIGPESSVSQVPTSEAVFPSSAAPSIMRPVGSISIPSPFPSPHLSHSEAHLKTEPPRSSLEVVSPIAPLAPLISTVTVTISISVTSPPTPEVSIPFSRASNSPTSNIYITSPLPSIQNPPSGIRSTIFNFDTSVSTWTSKLSCANESPDFCSSIGCTNLMSDASNCGTCGNTCNVICLDGICSCPLGQSPEAGGHCLNITTTPSVASAIPFTTTCSSGSTIELTAITCVGISIPKSPPKCTISDVAPDLCGSYCTSLQNDTFNCGVCGNVCDYACRHGECYCPSLSRRSDGNCCPQGYVFDRNTYICEEILCSSGWAFNISLDGCTPIASFALSTTTTSPISVSPPQAAISSSTSTNLSWMKPMGVSCPDKRPNWCPYSCDATTLPCTGICVDFTRDKNNCGSCGAICAGNTTCEDFVCHESVGHFVAKVLNGWWKRN